MADISLPQDREYYRIAVRNSRAYTGTMYHNHVAPSDVSDVLANIRSHEDNRVVKVERVVVRVTVTEIPFT